ncbi:MAG TPA: peptidylprolyl isomerase [Ferruginibacter sp.]|nr:peptidylprolyl isomerase [Ferruginibacter sp.]HMP21461.1 peptidylprolyl isomerase [Ferruginibacter sp.]
MSDITLTRGTFFTSKGEMHFELYDDATPIAVNNFKKLVADGFYNGLSFHRVIPGFMIQGGCPNGIGNGGPGYTIACETNAPKQRHDRGVISMAHRGPNTGGSQFFICHNRSNTKHLDGVHTAFGILTDADSMDVLDVICAGDIIEKIVLL